MGSWAYHLLSLRSQAVLRTLAAATYLKLSSLKLRAFLSHLVNAYGLDIEMRRVKGTLRGLDPTLLRVKGHRDLTDPTLTLAGSDPGTL